MGVLRGSGVSYTVGCCAWSRSLGNLIQPFLLAALTASTETRQRAFSAAVVARCCDHMATAVTGLIRLEMIECP